MDKFYLISEFRLRAQLQGRRDWKEDGCHWPGLVDATNDVVIHAFVIVESQ